MRTCHRNARMLLAGAISAFLCSAPPAAAGSQYVVIAVEPRSDRLPLGKVFVPNDVIRIPAGTTLTLLGEDGSVEAVEGPTALVVTDDRPDARGSGEASAAAASTFGLIADLLVRERGKTGLPGVSRSARKRPGGNRPEDPWAVSIDESGPACIRRGQVAMKRRDARKDLAFSVSFGRGQRIDGLTWPAGAPEYKLHDGVPPNAETFAFVAGGKTTRLEIKQLPARLDAEGNPASVLAWLVANGCKRQAMALVHGLAAEAGGTSGVQTDR